jgi:flagellar basal-body rod protein FlgB
MQLESLVFDEASVINNKLMELAQERQKVIANNMANAETPNYVRLDLDFQKKLKQLLADGELEQLQDYSGELVKDDKNPKRLDGNNVVLPQEMNDMMQNGVYFNLLAKAFSTRMSILKSAISGA